MEAAKRPKRWIAVCVTVAAVLCLVTSLLVVSTTPGKLVVTLQLIATIILAAASIGIWSEYSKKYVEYEVERRMKQEN